MRRFFLFYILSAVFSAGFTMGFAAPALQIKGENYGVENLTKGSLIFYNRTNMFFGDIPPEYDGWKVTRINANSGWQPGPLPALQVMPDADGYIYTLVADYEKPDVCAQWAADNGWQRMDGQLISFGDTDAAKLYVYRKACTKAVWIDVTQPLTFSGAIVMAPGITDLNNSGEEVDDIVAVPVSISAVGWMETGVLNNGSVAYANRSYVFGSVAAELAGLYVTRYNGGSPPKLKVTAGGAGFMYIAQSNEDVSYDVAENGWVKVNGMTFNYNDPNVTSFSVYRKPVEQGDVLEIIAAGWQGVLVLSSEPIDFSLVEKKPVPPPGVVVHNSKAVTKKFVGSPSITVLPDGTYLASHDYFGGIISDAFVYKSEDKGLSWERISEIKTMNWAKLFTRGDEIYLMGVAPKGTMGYGNVVILRSDDGGYSWTQPADSKHGLLMDGYYTCAPTPVLFHEGRIWKAMENQGKVDGWGPFGAFMMSVDENADLLDAANWTISNELQYVAGAVDAWTWLEGNAVVDKDGSVVDILRLHYGEDDKAGVIRVSDDGTTISFDPQTGISNVPGACKKFTINYDRVSGRYWTLSNYVLPADRENNNLERTRNTIALSWSENLVDWNIKEILLHTDNISKEGFQYVDWLFDGDDIIAVVRTAWEDETGEADSQHNANFLTFHRFKNFRYEKAGSANGIAVKRWYNDFKSAVALTFDDGFEAHYKYAYPVLKEHAVPATFFVNSGNLVHRGETQKERYGFWEDFKEMADDGYEIASHSLTHADLTAVDYDVLLDELQDDKANIERNTGYPCLTHAYPYCLNNSDAQQVASELFIGARQCGGIANDATLTKEGCYTLNSELLTWTNPRSIGNESADFERVKTEITANVRQNRNFGVLCLHEVLPFELLSTFSGYEIATTEWLGQMCAFLAEKKATGDIWPATFSEIIRYARERDNLRIRKTETDNEHIRYDFSVLAFLDTTMFDFPLTVTVSLPDAWKAARCLVSENGVIVSDSIYRPASGKFNLNVIPDRQTVDLIKQEFSAVENLPAEKIRCYPNPVRERLVLESDVPLTGDCLIYNGQGICLMNKTIHASGVASLDVSALTPGFYVVKLKQNQKEYWSRFIKE